MMLYVNGQDIRRLVLAIIEDEDTLMVYEREIGNELAIIERFLAGRQLTLHDLLGMVTISGPGSATALRSILSLLNALAMSLHIPLHSLDKAPDEEDAAIVRKQVVTTEQGVVLPIYLHEARITTSTKDSLRRTI